MNPIKLVLVQLFLLIGLKVKTMRKIFTLIKNMALASACVALFSTSAKALTYTAVASGNFNSTTTWSGGIAPSGTLTTGDIVIIGSAYTVTLTGNETFNGTASLTVDGTLTSGANASALIMTSGTLTGTGTIDVDSMSLGLVTGFTYTGTIMAQQLTSTTANISAAADITVDGNLYLTGGLLNITSGSLALSNNATLVVNGGSLNVGGSGSLDLSANYNVTYEGSSVNSGIELTGSGLQDVMVDLSSGAVTLTSDLDMNGMLTLNSGNLILNGNDLTLGTDANISAMGTGSISASASSNISINSMNSLSGALTFSAGNNTVNNLMINFGSTSGNVNLGSDLQVNGTLTLNMGTLTLDNNNLSFAVNGDVAASGTGSIVSTAGSDISITSNGSFTGAIRFSGTGNTVGDLTINMGSNTAMVNLGSDLQVSGTLDLTSGMVNVGTNDLSIAASGNVSGGSMNSFVITSNGGTLTMNLMAGGSNTYQVGTMLHYAPAVVTANTGSASGDVSVMVDDSVYANGNTGMNLSDMHSVVDATWFISSTASTGLDLDLEMMWSANMELNGFDRTNAYISHYTNGNWDNTAAASATTAVNGMYTINRDHIMSLSPFTVGDVNSTLKVNQVASHNAAITLYPNPVVDVVNYTSTVPVSGIDIYDVSGKLVKSVSGNNNSFSVSELAPGYYTARIKGQDLNSVQHFVKK